MVLNAQITARSFNRYDLLDAVANSTFRKGASPASAEGAKYYFRASSLSLKASCKRPVEANLWSETQRRELGLTPSEMVFILTD